MSRASYTIDTVTDVHVILYDNDGAVSVTNDAENVVREVNAAYPGRRIYYYDTCDQLDELKHDNGVFTGFAPGGPPL